MEMLGYYTISIDYGRFKYNAKILALYKTKEIVDNNGMDIDNIVFDAIDELFEGKLLLYNANKDTIEKAQQF